MQRFTYQSVAVSGAKNVPPTEIQKFVENKLSESSRGFISGRNIFVFDYDPLGAEIEANFPAIKKATVSRDRSLGNGLTVTIEERSPYARWCMADSECYLVDDQGIVFSTLNIATTSLPTQYVFTGPLSTTSESLATPPYGEVFGGEHFSGIDSFLKLLPGVGLTPLGVNIQNDTDFFVPLTAGYYLKASYGEEPETLIKNLSLILNADAVKGKEVQLEYIDLRFGNRVYYKFIGIIGTSTPQK
jgi:hypothetical protein